MTSWPLADLGPRCEVAGEAFWSQDGRDFIFHWCYAQMKGIQVPPEKLPPVSGVWGLSRPATAFILGSILVAFSLFHFYPRNWFRNHRNWIWSRWMLTDSWLHSSQEILPAGGWEGHISSVPALSWLLGLSPLTPIQSHLTALELKCFCFIL